MSGTGIETLSVLIVDDNVHMRALLRALLDCAGVQAIAEATDGESALQMLHEREIDLVLTDMAMKPMDGITFTQRVRKDSDSPNPFVPIIMITGHTQEHRVVQARDAGISELLAKPVSNQSLLAHITGVMEKPRGFVRCGSYFGPDRRRRGQDGHAGPWRRRNDCDGRRTN